MRSNLSYKRKFSKLANLFISLLILSGFLISCDWNSSEKRNSERAEMDGNTGITKNDSSYIVDVTAVDYAFGMPTEIPSGWITFRMQNMGKEVHHGVIAKFVDSLSYKALSQMISTAVEKSTLEAYDPIYAVMEKDYGGPAMLSPGLTGETTVYLEPGLYTLSCHLRTAEGIYHMDKGMNRPFVVTKNKSGTNKPATTVDLTLSNFAIEVGPITAGDQVFNINYEDYDYHNVHLAKLKKNQEIEDLKIWMTSAQAPSPFLFLGGAEQVPQGETSTFKAAMEPGRYALVAFGQSIAGMVAEINVPEKGQSVPVSKENINNEVRIYLDLEGTNYPRQLPIGRTPVTIKNTGNNNYRYILALIKEGSSKEDLKNYLFEVVGNRNDVSEETEVPYYHIWEKKLSPGEKNTFSLKVEEKNYVLVGPLIPGQSLKSQWREENLIHMIKGIKKNDG